MLTDPYIQQLVHLRRRLTPEKSTILNHANNCDAIFPNGVIERIKSHSPISELPIDMATWMSDRQIEVHTKRKGNKKYDAVLSGQFIEATLSFRERFEQIHNETKQDGYIVIDLPLSVNGGWFAYQPNLFIELAKQNNYSITYFKAMDHAGQFPIVIDSSKQLTSTAIKEYLYKYNDTTTMRLNITMKKTNTDPFTFEESNE
jgi:hypothetical protein